VFSCAALTPDPILSIGSNWSKFSNINAILDCVDKGSFINSSEKGAVVFLFGDYSGSL
jgi:hypothetical protein